MKKADVHKVLDALDNYSKVKPSNDFLKNLETLAINEVEQQSASGGRSIFVIAACILLLLAANIHVAYKSTLITDQQVTASHYESELNPINLLYNE